MMTKLTRAEVDAKLEALPGWIREGDFISKHFRFEAFMDGIGFVGRLARIAERLDHHPDIHVVWTTVTLKIQTHDEGGITALDFRLAAEIEKRLSQKNLNVTKK